MKTLILILIFSSFIYSQTVYEIPFASKGNEIELKVFNDSKLNLANVAVTTIEKPEWVKFDSEQEVISELKSNQNGKIVFGFDIEKEAKVMEEEIIKLQIMGDAQIWYKEIKIAVLPPDKFELNQNYPNPFNPTTTISYTIPGNKKRETSNVKLMIYDILGREIETLVNEEQKSGYYKSEWNAVNYASGMYIYQLSMKSSKNEYKFIRKKMLLTK